VDVVKAEQAEQELNRFINSRAQRKGRAQANVDAERQRAEDARKLAELREANRLAWCEHLRRTAAAHLRIARDARARARRLEQGDAA
jgi:hypothetical protein